MKILKIIRKFESFNFHGVPEGPEPSFERNSHAQYTERQTGQAVAPFTNDFNYNEGTLLGYIKDDFENKVETFIKAPLNNDRV